MAPNVLPTNIPQISWIIGDSMDTSNQSSLKSARAGRASRAGARAGRIVRLVRMVKLYKYFKKTNPGDESRTNLGSGSGIMDSSGGIVAPSRVSSNALDDKAEEDRRQEEQQSVMELPAESHVGAAMSDLTTRRVIVLVLVMLIAIPLMTYSTTDTAPNFGTLLVHRMAKENVTYPGEYDVRRALLLRNTKAIC